jgi:hypothetical protein
MQKKTLILGHLGLGDTIIMYGMVRYYAMGSDHVMYVAKKRYEKACTQLFSNLDNVDLLLVNDDADISPNFGADPAMLEGYERAGYDVVRIGLHASKNQKLPRDPVFARNFYYQVGLDPSMTHSFFDLRRSCEREVDLYKRVVRKHGLKYAVVHQDATRGLFVRPEHLPSNVSIYDVDDPEVRSDNIFDYCMVLEKAYEIHGMDSCFMLLADRLRNVRCPMTCHDYVRKLGTRPGLYRKNVRMLRS